MRKNTRGFSLVEAVVAMAVILIITSAVLSVMLMGTRAQRSELEHHRAGARLSDIVAVYRVSADETKFNEADFDEVFKENLAFALGREGELSLESVPLAKGYTAEIEYVDGKSIKVSVSDAKGRERKSMGFTFPEFPEPFTQEVAP